MTEHILSTGDQLITDLRDWAAEYASQSNGVMEVLDYRPQDYEGQDGISVQGEPNAAGVVDSIAIAAQPRYLELHAALEQNEAETNRVSMIGELLKGGDNVVLTTNHGDLIDIAVAQAAVYSTLEKLGYKMHNSNQKDDGYEVQTGIIISKMVAFLAYKLHGMDPAPCTDVLKVLETETFLSYPKTDSTKKHLKDRFIPDEIDRHNKKMRSAVIHRLGEGSMLLAMAASGTTDKPVADDPSTIGMGKIGTGTLDLMRRPHTFVAPMAVWYKDEVPIMELVDVPRAINSGDDAHRAMGRIATTLTTKVPNLRFAYKAA